jgi:hypothetical protein
MKSVNGRLHAVDNHSEALRSIFVTPRLRLVFSELSPQLTCSPGISKVCKALRHNVINDD